MNVVGLDVQLLDSPTALLAFLLNQIAAVPGNISHQNGFSAFGGPDQMIEDQVDAVFISLIFHNHQCCILYFYT